MQSRRTFVTGALGLGAIGVAGQAAAGEAVKARGTGPSAPVPNTNGHLQRITEAKLLKIGVKADSPPFCFIDKENNPQGFDIDLGFRLARALDAQPLFVTVTSGDRIEKLKAGDVDVIIATLTATRRRAKLIDFSTPYFQDQQMLLVKTNAPVQSYRDLEGKKIAVASGSTSLDNIKVVAPGAQVVEAATLGEAFEKLKKGEADALTGDGLALKGLRLGSEKPEEYKIAGEGFSVEPFVVGLPQNDSEFRAKIDDVLTDLWNAGAWTRIFNKWLGAETAYNMEAKFQMPVLPP